MRKRILLYVFVCAVWIASKAQSQVCSSTQGEMKEKPFKCKQEIAKLLHKTW